MVAQRSLRLFPRSFPAATTALAVSTTPIIVFLFEGSLPGSAGGTDGSVLGQGRCSGASRNAQQRGAAQMQSYSGFTVKLTRSLHAGSSCDILHGKLALRKNQRAYIEQE
jgi:hypothetical protein